MDDHRIPQQSTESNDTTEQPRRIGTSLEVVESEASDRSPSLSFVLPSSAGIGEPGELPAKTLLTKSLSWKYWLSLTCVAAVSIFIPTSYWLWADLYGFPSQDRVIAYPCRPSWFIQSGQGFQSFFSVAPVTPDLSFDAVKSIDISWSIVIGRGGQAVLLWISYRVYVSCLIQIMETTPVSYALYMELALGQPRMSSIWQMTKFMFQRRRAWRHRYLMAWVVSALAWVMAWQIFTDAMTSYASSGDPYPRIIDGSFIPLEDILQSDLAFRPIGGEVSSAYGAGCTNRSYVDLPILVPDNSPGVVPRGTSCYPTHRRCDLRPFSLVLLITSNLTSKTTVHQNSLLVLNLSK